MSYGPLIDPPFAQHRYRTAGVYERPDERTDAAGRVIFEVWDREGHCIASASVAGWCARLTAVRLWEFFDLVVDDRKAVSGEVARYDLAPRLHLTP